MRSKKEYTEGYDAYWNRVDYFRGNPYVSNTQEYKNWREGFIDALREEAGHLEDYYR